MNKPNERIISPRHMGKRAWLKPAGVLMLATLLAPMVRAETWNFKILGAPIALNKASPKFESIRVTGSGTFDPVLGVASASGTYTLFNAFDHPNGPLVNATWHSSSFVSWTKGVLTISFESSDALANPDGGGQIILQGDGVSGPMVDGEPYIIPDGGSGGSVRFRKDDDDSFFPGAPEPGIWAFNLLGPLKAIIPDSTHAEAMTVTGGGTFNTALNTVTASGTFAISGAPDEPGGPNFNGTWKATALKSFLPSGGHNSHQQGGTLTITADFSFTGGPTLPGVQLTVIRPFVDGAFQDNNDAVTVVLDPDETFSRPPGGSGGKTMFQLLSH
jgi:hypothetical protein